MTEMTDCMKMYYMKPVYSLPDNLPQAKVMYEMKNIHNCHRIATKIEQQASHPDFAALDLRQEKILGQLAELKKIIANLSDIVKNTDQTETPTVIKKEKIVKDPVTMDLVIKVDRSQIPYSLLALKKIWQDTYFNISCHTHSEKNTRDCTDEITTFEKAVQFNKQTQQSNNVNVVNLILIWKNTPILETNTDFHNSCLLGETNLLRFLSRIIYSHNYEEQMSIDKSIMIDTILDQCYEVHISRCEKIFKQFIMKFDNILSSGNTWFASKTEPTVADIAAWSVIKSHPVTKLPINVTKWFDWCQKQFYC